LPRPARAPPPPPPHPTHPKTPPGIDGRLAALSLAYVTNLLGGLTHYASAQAASYYAAGYYTVVKNCAIGGLVCFTSLGIFLGIGMGWWRVVGLWPDNM
jgi:DASS family divalent anion:Na+ symporter